MATIAEVGIAYVTLAPSLRGFKGKLEKQIAPEADKAGKSSGGKFGLTREAIILGAQRPRPRATLDDEVSRPLRRTNLELTATDKREARPTISLDTGSIFGAISAVGRALDYAARDRVSTIRVNQSNSVSSPDARANGGPVKGGRMYLVGERGPELFTASQSGYIHSNDSLRSSGGTAVGVASRGLPSSVTLMVDGYDMQAWFEERYDAEGALP